MLLAVMLRQRNYKMNHFLPACLSLIALRCRVPVLFWTLLSEQGILYSRNWTKDIALELGKQLMPSSPILRTNLLRMQRRSQKNCYAIVRLSQAASLDLSQNGDD